MKLILPFCLLFLLQQMPCCQTTAWAPSPAIAVEVYFDFGKDELLPAADSALGTLLKYCQPPGEFLVKITAHTDSIGSLANNESLSRRRANAVIAYLKGKGFGEKAIQVATFGEKKPAAPNATEDGRQLNRRATVEVFKPMPLGMVEGQVLNAKTGEPVAANVVLHTKDSRDTLQADQQGFFKKSFPLGTVVGIDAYAHCFFMKSDMVKAEKVAKPVQLAMKPALVGEAIDIDNLYFVGNEAVLLPPSKPELPKILQFLQLNPEMKIEIAGHVNQPNLPPVSGTSWEYKLSVSRAKLVHDYLLENGIPQSRITYKGYGNWEMRFPQARTEEQMALNRRVEIRILEGACE
jgi:outer membrane protein OmpA-like peptidoglycan-associated protein